ncbi:hypothetical protein B5F40_08255 [Gordonibacter sp. An230]|uniref:hypothetical protein n=1 Tax=Gordonibacter sp. An230 TaxID=1965592 RepID=UPI000B3916C4|nr:hypothetical protein [Gordonibacter sp. An230]OUO90017.1 hypothetical protein B5F40_08255 [Gordonibacter sp. An230]
MGRKIAFSGVALAAVCIVALAAAALAANLFPGNIVSQLIDRANPLAPSATAYARVPPADSYVDSWRDASGAYDDYRYLVDAVDAQGAPLRVSVNAFGSKLGEAEQPAATAEADGAEAPASSTEVGSAEEPAPSASDEPFAWMRLQVKGATTVTWEYVAEEDVPRAAADML